jgi:hypothetical protein
MVAPLGACSFNNKGLWSSGESEEILYLSGLTGRAGDRVCPCEIPFQVIDRLAAGHSHPVVLEDDAEQRVVLFIHINECVDAGVEEIGRAHV